MKVFADVVGFEWDDGNKDKNFKKHGISSSECEEVFEDERRQFYPDIYHSRDEERYVVVGATKRKRMIRLVFSVRDEKFRVISARPINRKERNLYE